MNKKLILIQIILFMMLWVPLSLFGQASHGEFIMQGTVLIKYTGSAENVIIPMGVTGINREAFYHCGIKSVTIPNTVTIIGDAAFAGNKLTEINIPGSVAQIGAYAFSNNELVKVNMANGVIVIDTYAFATNFDLSEVTIPDSVASIGYGAFYFCMALNTVTVSRKTKVAGMAFLDNVEIIYRD